MQADDIRLGKKRIQRRRCFGIAQRQARARAQRMVLVDLDDA